MTEFYFVIYEDDRGYRSKNVFCCCWIRKKLSKTEKRWVGVEKMTDIRPDYYKSGGLEAFDVIDAFDLDFNLGNAFKYIARAGKKGNKVEDLRKAVTYLNFEIEDIKKANREKLIEEKMRLSPTLESGQSEMDKIRETLKELERKDVKVKVTIKLGGRRIYED